MFHIPAHKAITNPPGQWINPDTREKKVEHEVREPPPPPYKDDKPPPTPE